MEFYKHRNSKHKTHKTLHIHWLHTITKAHLPLWFRDTLPPRSPLDVKISLYDMRIFTRFMQQGREQIVHHRKNQSVQFKNIQMFGYSSVGSLKVDNFVVETFLYNICAGTDHGMKVNSTSSFSLISFK